MDMFQSVLNTAVRLVFTARLSDHITSQLLELHWLSVLERIQFRLCVGIPLPPRYSAALSRREPSFDHGLHARCRLRSADILTLLMPPTRRSSLGDRAFPVSSPRACNKLLVQSEALPPCQCFVQISKHGSFDCRSIDHLWFCVH